MSNTTTDTISAEFWADLEHERIQRTCPQCLADEEVCDRCALHGFTW